ncbi:MAG: hypothetical protein EOO89_14110, partial [Pedobacter sp.]
MFAACLFAMSVKAQRPSVSVDQFYGKASVSMPLLNVTLGNINMPIGLSYSGGGIKVKEAEGSAGLGWNFVAGGEIVRQLRGLPDDVRSDQSSQPRLGWIHNTNGTKIINYIISNDNNQSTTTDETADLAYLNANFSDLSDTEPDVFLVNVPGLNCKLVFDNNHNIRTIPYMDIKVDFELESNTLSAFYGNIKKFTIVTEQGIKYSFETLQRSRKTSISTSPGTISFFKREYEQYKNEISFTDSWKLSSVSDFSGNVVYLLYVDKDPVGSNERIAFTKGSGAIVYPFTISNSTTQKRLDRILYGDGPSINDVQFTYSRAFTSGVSMISRINAMGKVINFSYSDILTNTPGTHEKKSLLTTVSQSDTLTYVKLAGFRYYGVNVNNGTINLPDSTGKGIDTWGYYNGTNPSSLIPQVYINPSSSGYERYRNNYPFAASSAYSYTLPGAVRGIDMIYAVNGSLEYIDYPEGGNTRLSYESQSYYDQTAVNAISGGGLRVSQVTDHDGISSANDMVKTYNYNNPATGSTSGKAISVPLLSFTTPYTTSGTAEFQWQNSVLRLEENISQEDNAIIYTHVKVIQSGAGSTQFEYKAPATYWDTSSTPDWTPTLVNVARPSSVSGGYTSTEKNTYPFVPNTNYDFERGLLSKVTQFNDAGNKVMESSYNYIRTNAPTVITGLKFEDNAAVKSYAKYSIYSSVGNLTQQENVIAYDAPSTSQFNQTSTNYTYGSAAHKSPTLISTTNSDGSISRRYSKYAKDYNVASHTDDQTTAIYNLQQLGVNPQIESYS